MREHGLHFFFSFHDEIPIFFQRQISIFIAKEIGVTFFVRIGMRKVFKTEAIFKKVLFGGFGHFFFFGQKALEYAAVFS